MSGYYECYVLGGAGGFMGADGINPLELIVLVGAGSAQWLEGRYMMEPAVEPLAGIRVVIPDGPDTPDMLLDALIVFAPHYFAQCPSFEAVQSELADHTDHRLYFGESDVPASWHSLREEARPIYERLGLWRAEFETFDPTSLTT